jgi:hypothetical protein
LLKFPAVKLQRLARVLPARWLHLVREKQRSKQIRRAVRSRLAKTLSYIHPAILDAYIDGVVTLKARGGRSGRDNTALSPSRPRLVSMRDDIAS